jgi:hypothetical protein
MAENMKLLCALAWLFVTTSTVTGTGKISGTVVDQNGVPVPHISVEFSPVGIAWSGGFPLAKTDEHGSFVKEIGFGRWDITPLERTHTTQGG